MNFASGADGAVEAVAIKSRRKKMGVVSVHVLSDQKNEKIGAFPQQNPSDLRNS